MPNAIPRAAPAAGRGIVAPLRALPALAGIAGALLVLWATARHGPGLSPDSINYIAGARHLLAGQGLTDAQGNVIHKWPPLFPAALAALGLTGIGPAAGARFLNAACFGLTVAAAGVWLLGRLRSRPLALLALAALLFSQPLLAVVTFAWSEALFILLVVLALLAGERYGGRGEPAALAGFGLLTGLALLTRLPGAALLAVGVVLVALRPVPPRARAREGAAYLALALAPLAAWLLRNWLLLHTLTGQRTASSLGPGENLGTVLRMLRGWVVPPAPFGGPWQAVATTAFAAGTGLVAWALWRHRRRIRWRVPPALRPHVLFVAAYLGLVVAARSAVGGTGGIEPRYLVPALVPLLFIAACAADRARSAWRRHGPRPRLFAAALSGAAAVWLLAYPVPYAGSFVHHQAGYGAGGYATDGWENVDVFRYLRKRPLPGTVLSNRPELVYWFSGRPARTSPRRSQLTAPAGARTARPPTGPALLLWIHAATPDNLARPDELAAGRDLRTVTRFPDGSATLYVLRPAPAPSPPPASASP